MGLISKEWMDAYHAYVLQSLAGKQPTLVSGTNIKTLNGQSLLGEGNINFLQLVAANSLPTAGEQYLNKVYLVPSRDPDEAAHNIKEEWVVVEVPADHITYNNIDYPIINRGSAGSIVNKAAVPQGNAGATPENTTVLGAYDSETATISNPYIRYNDPNPIAVKVLSGYWDSFEFALGDAYTVESDGKTYVATGNGWVDVAELSIGYAWEIIGSTQIDLNNYYSKSEIDAMLNGATFSLDANNRLIITKNNTRYFTQLTELSKPSSPDISVVSASVVTGNATFTATCPTSGATIKYSLDNGSTWSNGPTVTVPSGFSNNADNTTKTQVVKLKAIKNGEESDIVSVTVTITPKVASGSVNIVRNNNNNDYSTQATITLTPSASHNATSEYSQDGGSTWTSFIASVTLTTTSSQAANKYQVRATKSDYVDATKVYSTGFVLNKKKFYYGMGDSSLANETAITSLAGGGSAEKATMAGTYNITASTINKYVWFCGTGTLNNVTSGGFIVPMQSVTVVDGYNCYRSTSAVQETGTNEFKVE